MSAKNVRLIITFFSLIILNLVSVNTVYAESCACIEKDGCCHCPKDRCACQSGGGKCDCNVKESKNNIVSTKDVSVIENLNQTIDNAYDHSESNCESNSCVDYCENPCSITSLKQHQLFIGPEVYYLRRNRIGSKQNGWIYGGRLGYERIKRYRIYWGIEGLYTASSDLKGKTGEEKVKLKFEDRNIEGRFGYTFQQKSGYLVTLIPFVGFGYTEQISFMKRPADLNQKSRMTFDYFTTGFITQIYPHKNFVIGANFKARFLFNSKVKESHMLTADNFTHQFKHYVQYRAELPITYRLDPTCDRFAISLVPFYEYRHYGTQLGVPYDFIDTKYALYGFDIKFMYLF